MAFSPTEIYVDPSIAANSGTGTIGDPFGDLQYALNNSTWNSSGGNRYNIKAGVAEAVTSPLSLTTLSPTPSTTNPLIFEGYTAAAGDGGIGTCTATTSFFSGAYTNVSFANLSITGSTSSTVIDVGGSMRMVNCTVTNSSTGKVIQMSSNSTIHGCRLETTSSSASSGVVGPNNAFVAGTTIVNSYVEYYGNNGAIRYMEAVNCFVWVDHPTADGIWLGQNDSAVGCVVYAASAVNGFGIYTVQPNAGATFVLGNYVEGFTGAGAYAYKHTNATDAIPQVMANNYYYNCTGDVDFTGPGSTALMEAPIATGVSAITNPGTDNSLDLAAIANDNVDVTDVAIYPMRHWYDDTLGGGSSVPSVGFTRLE